MLAVVTLTRSTLDGMMERGRGWICNVSSVVGFQAAPNLTVYAATKAFVTSFTEGLHEELRGTDVSATALCPGLPRTEFQSVSSSRAARDYPGVRVDVRRRGSRRSASLTGGATHGVGPGFANKVFVATADVLPRGARAPHRGNRPDPDASHPRSRPPQASGRLLLADARQSVASACPAAQCAATERSAEVDGGELGGACRCGGGPRSRGPCPTASASRVTAWWRRRRRSARR